MALLAIYPDRPSENRLITGKLLIPKQKEADSLEEKRLSRSLLIEN